MLGKNIRYYRLRNRLTKKALAERCGVSAMSITHYENDQRTPDTNTLRKIADAMDIRVIDFIRARNSSLKFQHGDFRKHAGLTQSMQQCVREMTEEYFDRFFEIVDLLPDNVLPPPLSLHQLTPLASNEENARRLRHFLHLPSIGPTGNLVEHMENLGIPVFMLDLDIHDFFGMNGCVNDRPFIVLSDHMTPERMRTTLLHEVVHIAFNWEHMNEQEIETKATEIAGAVLFPKNDALRELGPHRDGISRDMDRICIEYGISKSLLAVRAEICGILSKEALIRYFKYVNRRFGKAHEPSLISKERPFLIEQLVYQSVTTGLITPQKGGELLGVPTSDVEAACQMENDF